MSSVELIVLGFLIERSMNPYELANVMEEKQVTRILKVSEPAVYKCCKRLAAQGHLIGKKVREGELPEKTVYSVTANGKSHFRRLMEHFSTAIVPFYFGFNAFLWNIDKLKRSEGQELLNNLRSELLDLQTWIVAHEKEREPQRTFAGASIVRQYRMVIDTLITWIGDTIARHRKRPVNRK